MNKELYYVYGNHNLEQFRELVLRKGKGFPVVGATGSIDYYSQHAAGGTMIDGYCKYDKARDLIIMGLGGSMLYNYGESQYSEKQMAGRIMRMMPHLLYNKQWYGRYLDILVTHAPPLGIGDGEDLCHKGFSCFRTFMDKYKPKYLLHGHVHLIDLNDSRITQYGETKVINIFKNYVLDDPDLGVHNE